MANFGGFLQALGQSFGGYAQDQQVQQQRAMAAQKLAMEQEAARQAAQLHGAQMEDYRAQAAQRTDAAARAKGEQDVWGQYGEAALNGDQAAMAQVIGAYGPDRAGQIITSLRKEPRAAKKTYDPLRGVIVNEDEGSFSPLSGLPARENKDPTPHWISAGVDGTGQPVILNTLTGETRAGGGTRGGRTNGEPPNIAATRKDLKDFQSQQIRAEHDVTGAKSDIRSLLRDHPRASQPLAAQRTAADSALANQYGTANTQLQGAEARKQRLTQSADSTQSVLNGLRAGGVPAPSGVPGTGAPGAPAPLNAPQPAPADRIQRAKSEQSGFQEVMKQIDAQFPDPQQRIAKKREAMMIYNTRMQQLNAGRDPDAP